MEDGSRMVWSASRSAGCRAASIMVGVQCTAGKARRVARLQMTQPITKTSKLKGRGRLGVELRVHVICCDCQGPSGALTTTHHLLHMPPLVWTLQNFTYKMIVLEIFGRQIFGNRW